MVCFRECQALTEPRLTEVLDLHCRYESVWRRTMQECAKAGVFRPYDPLTLKGPKYLLIFLEYPE